MAKKEKKTEKTESLNGNSPEAITTKQELKEFLISLREKLNDESTATIFAMSALSYVLNLPNIYELFDQDTKECARDLWLRLKTAGMQIKDPPLLFGAEV